MHALEFALALLVGLSLGLLGGGGSILTVPIFIYVAGYDAKTAIAMSLPVVGLTSLVGAIGHWRDGNVNPRAALTFGLVAMASAFAGARVAEYVRTDFQMALFAVVLLSAAVAMLRPRRTHAPPPGPASLPLVLLVGFGVGLLTGLIGVGGGFLVVPALVLLAGIPMKQAIGTSLAVIAMNAVAGSAGYMGRVEFPWGFALAFTAFAVVGILVGTRMVRYVSQQTLRRAFAVGLGGMGMYMLYQSLTAL